MKPTIQNLDKFLQTLNLTESDEEELGKRLMAIARSFVKQRASKSYKDYLNRKFFDGSAQRGLIGQKTIVGETDDLYIFKPKDGNGLFYVAKGHLDYKTEAYEDAEAFYELIGGLNTSEASTFHPESWWGVIGRTLTAKAKWVKCGEDGTPLQVVEEKSKEDTLFGDNLYLDYHFIRKMVNLFNSNPRKREPIPARILKVEDHLIVGNQDVGFVVNYR